MRIEMNHIRAELRGEPDAPRPGPAAPGGDARGQIADLLERVTLIERRLGLVPAALPRSAAEAETENRPPLPPRPPPGR